MQVGRTKDQGLYNNPPAAEHPAALAAVTLLQYNTLPSTSMWFCLANVDIHVRHYVEGSNNTNIRTNLQNIRRGYVVDFRIAFALNMTVYLGLQ